MRLLIILSVFFIHHVTSQGFGQLLLAYYSGVGLDTVGSGGVNSLSLAFFSPGAMLTSGCNFNDAMTPCVKPASGAGPSLGLGWALSTINSSASMLSGNTAPTRGRKPTIFFGFGGQSEGGASWDHIFSSASNAELFGQNCAKLVQAVYTASGQKAFIGIDLDIEGTQSTLPNFPAFIQAFRSAASPNGYPLMLDSLSGLANSDSSDHYKVAIMQKYGPPSGVNFLNMMVNNVQSSCDDMKKFWLDSALNFIPPPNKILGFWGENLSAWILKNPGCTDGSSPLFSWMKSNGAGMGIWQWWSGPNNEITHLIKKVRK
jgi:hypothetical protein